MSSRLTDEDDLIEWAANLHGNEWRRLANAMTWVHRRQDADRFDLPQELRPLHEIVLDRQAWESIRRRVAKQRRALYRLRVKEKQESAILRRRAYMREYMNRYRKRR